MSARAQIKSLLSIINQAAFEALEEYEKHGQSVPTVDSVDVHPLDNAHDKLQLKKIISKLEGACEQLCSTLAPPTHTIMNRAQDFGWACLRVAVQQKIPDELQKHQDGLHVNALAHAVKIHPMKLASILRVLAARHCFREVAPDVFSNNRLSIVLVSNHPMSALVDLITVDGQKTALALADYLVDPQFGQSLIESEAAFQYGHGVDGITFYDWLQRKEQEGRRKVMMKAMISMNEVLGSSSALHVYPWNELRTVCDVGSGMGSFSRALLGKFPEIRVIQFDLPRTIALAKESWQGDFGDRVAFVEGDFFEKIPAKDCDAYYLRNILHNWSDEKALVILRSVRSCMAPHSKVLIHDNVLRHMNPPPHLESATGGLDIAPEPLLPNYGAGSIRSCHQDLQMMMAYNAKERTTVELTKIAEQAELRLMSVIDLGEMGLFEFSAITRE